MLAMALSKEIIKLIFPVYRLPLTVEHIINYTRFIVTHGLKARLTLLNNKFWEMPQKRRYYIIIPIQNKTLIKTKKNVIRPGSEMIELLDYWFHVRAFWIVYEREVILRMHFATSRRVVFRTGILTFEVLREIIANRVRSRKIIRHEEDINRNGDDFNRFLAL